MLDVKRAAASLGISLRGVKASFGELTTSIPGPKVLHLEHPGHFVVMVQASSDWAQFLDRGVVVTAPRGDVEKRYSGNALVLEERHEGRGPALQLDGFHYSFGVVGVGQDVEHAFAVWNAGDEDLVVGLQARGCAGPDASIGKQTLAPGESTDVTMKFRVAAAGAVTKTVRLLSNDLSRPVVFLTMHGTVPHDLHVSRTRLYVAVDKGGAAQARLDVTGPTQMELRAVTCDRGLFEVVLSEPEITADQRKIWSVELGLRSADAVGEIQDQLTIRTTHAERPVITVPITGRIRGDLEVVRPAVFFGFAECGEGLLDQEVTIRSRSGTPFTTKQGKLDAPGVSVGDPVQVTPSEWKLSVTLNPEGPGIIDAKLILTTDVPGEETIEIPVYAHVLAEE